MIVDTITNIQIYKNIIPLLVQVKNYIKTNNLQNMKTGKHTIITDELYVIISDYETKPSSLVVWESHRKFLDLQLVISGNEILYYTPRNILKVKQEYNETDDYMLYETDDGIYSGIILESGNFCILYPDDAHRPGCSCNTISPVKKAVFKIKI